MPETKNNSILEDYKSFINEMVQKQMVIIGPQIAFDKAKNIPGLSIDAAGTVISLSGDPYLVVKNLLDEYSSLSQPITQTILCSAIEKYPALKEIFGRAATKIELSCPYLLEEGIS
jgi:hypothetical protein